MFAPVSDRSLNEIIMSTSLVITHFVSTFLLHTRATYSILVYNKSNKSILCFFFYFPSNILDDSKVTIYKRDFPHSFNFCHILLIIRIFSSARVAEWSKPLASYSEGYFELSVKCGGLDFPFHRLERLDAWVLYQLQ